MGPAARHSSRSMMAHGRGSAPQSHAKKYSCVHVTVELQPCMYDCARETSSMQ